MKTLKRQELIKRIDRLFQACRRYDGAWKKNGQWYNRCVTSGMVLPIEKIQAGHWIPRGCYATRWDPTNCNPQCARCNLYKSGAYIEYSHWIYTRDKNDTLLLMALQLCSIMDDVTRKKLYKTLHNKSDFAADAWLIGKGIIDEK